MSTSGGPGADRLGPAGHGGAEETPGAAAAAAGRPRQWNPRKTMGKPWENGGLLVV